MIILAFITVACLIVALAAGFSVLGAILGRLFRWHWILRQGQGLNAVVGLAGGLLFFEIWNFFYPVNGVSAVVLSGLILCSAIVFRRSLLEAIRRWFRNRSALVSVQLLILLLTVSLFGLGPSEHGHFDTGLYYLTSIRWAHEYPVVPGLANLHSRLGYNQSLFLFIAFLSSLLHMGLERACQLVNPLFVFISGWAVLDFIRLNLLTDKAKRVRLYVILLLCPLFFLGSHMWISAPTSDIAAVALSLPGALAFFCCLEEIFERDEFEAKNWLFVLVICGCTLAKLKLSYMVLGGIAVGIAALALSFIRPQKFWWFWIWPGLVSMVLVVPWAVRGVVLTGYPFYPLTVIRFRTDWAVPRENAEMERLWIYSWARQPNKLPQSVLQNNDWFLPWVERNAKDPENVFLFLFGAAGLGSGILSFATPMSRERRLTAVLLLAQTSLALIFWFKTAPDPRFGYATLLLFGVNGLYSFASAISGLSTIRASIFTWAITAGSLWRICSNELPLIEHSEKKFPQGFPKPELEYEVTTSGLWIGIPKDQKAWNAGLLVTPYFNPDLVLRGRELRDGFRINRD